MKWPIEKMPSEQLVQIFALRRGYEPLRADCSVVRSDGVDLQQLLAHEVRSRYASALMTLAIEYLPTEDVSSRTRLVVLPDGSGAIDLPENVVRTGEVKLSSWIAGVSPTAEDDRIVQAQSNQWSRGGRYEPVAVEHENRLYVYSPDPKGDAIERLTVVCMPGINEPYAITEPLLNAIININTEL